MSYKLLTMAWPSGEYTVAYLVVQGCKERGVGSRMLANSILPCLSIAEIYCTVYSCIGSYSPRPVEPCPGLERLIFVLEPALGADTYFQS
jgi:hypothetical protein